MVGFCFWFLDFWSFDFSILRILFLENFGVIGFLDFGIVWVWNNLGVRYLDFWK